MGWKKTSRHKWGAFFDVKFRPLKPRKSGKRGSKREHERRGEKFEIWLEVRERKGHEHELPNPRKNIVRGIGRARGTVCSTTFSAFFLFFIFCCCGIWDDRRRWRRPMPQRRHKEKTRGKFSRRIAARVSGERFEDKIRKRGGRENSTNSKNYSSNRRRLTNAAQHTLRLLRATPPRCQVAHDIFWYFASHHWWFNPILLRATITWGTIKPEMNRNNPQDKDRPQLSPQAQACRRHGQQQ